MPGRRSDMYKGPVVGWEGYIVEVSLILLIFNFCIYAKIDYKNFSLKRYVLRIL